MPTFGVDNFVGDLTLDGSTANFHFVDPDDIKNVADVSVSEKEFPENVKDPSSREVSDYAYSLVAEKLNAKRSERISREETTALQANQAALKAEKQVTAQHLSQAQDNRIEPTTTEKRDDGVTQNVYNTKTADSNKK